MKNLIYLLAAGVLLVPAVGQTTEEQAHPSVVAAEASADTSPVNEEAKRPAEDAALDEEPDAFGDESMDARDEDGYYIPVPYEAAEGSDHETTEPKQPASVARGEGDDASYDAGAYGKLTAIAPVSLADGDWVFIEGDERRGWFFDRSMMTKNTDGTISYWQLILYNDFGRAQFIDAMHDEEYERLSYTLQRRVLDLKKNTIRTYEIIAYDGENAVITDGDRDGHAVEIRPQTMAEKERDAVKKAARKLKAKK